MVVTEIGDKSHCWVKQLGTQVAEVSEQVRCILMHLIPCLRRLRTSKRDSWCIEMHPTR